MLSDKAKLLLSAFVDGALSPQESAAAEKLVRESAEARSLVKKLGDNIQKIKTLARRSLGNDFPGQVLSQLASAVPVVTMPLAAFESGEQLVKKPRLRRGMPAWAVGGIAASIIGAIVIGSALWLRGQLDYNPDLLPGGANPPVATNKVAPPKEVPAVSNPVDNLVASVVRGSGEHYADAKQDVAVVPPKAQQPRFTFGDLQNQKSFDSLKWELAQSSGSPGGVHLDVTVKYNARSLSRIIESFHKNGVQLVVTPPAEASMKKNRPLLVYAENVQADQLALALKELGEIDVQGKKREPSTFDAVRVAPGAADDHTRVAERLGIDAKQLKTPTAPVSKVSALGVVLPADRPTNPAAISEIRGFLAGRGPVQIGTLHVFLHLQPK
jgi:hypothetical protein